GKLLDANGVARGDSILFPAGADDCVCHGEGARKLDPVSGVGKGNGSLDLVRAGAGSASMGSPEWVLSPAALVRDAAGSSDSAKRCAIRAVRARRTLRVADS